MYSMFWSRVVDILQNSFFGRLYLAIVRWFGAAFHESYIYKFFVAKDMSKYAESSKIATLLRKALFHSKFTELVSQSVLVRGVCLLPQMVLSSPMYIFSLFLLPSGIILFIRYFGNISYMIISALIILCGIILLNFKIAICEMIKKSFLIGAFCSFFNIRTDYHENDCKITVSAIAFIVGCIAGVASYFLNEILTIVVFLALMLFPIVISSPLLLLVITLFSGIALSTTPALILAVVTLVVIICRLFCGYEKLPKLRAVYILVMLYTLVTLYYTFNGFGGSDGILAGAIQFIFLTVFFSICVVINNEDKFRKFILAFSASTLYTGFIGLYQVISGQGGTGWAKDDAYIGGLRRISSTFLNPNVYGEFLIFAICIITVALLMSKTMRQRMFLLICLCIQIINLALTYSRGCYLAVILSALIIVWFCDKRLLGFGFLALPALPYVLPQNVMTRIMSVASSLKDSSVTYRFSIWRASLRVIENHWYIGSGIGTVAFTSFYQNYMLSGVTAQHSHNTFMQITIELSAVATVLIIFIMLFMCRDVGFVLKNKNDLKSKFMVIPLLASFAGVMLEGLVDYIFYNNIIYMVFWLVLGLLVSALNIISGELEDNKGVLINEKV